LTVPWNRIFYFTGTTTVADALRKPCPKCGTPMVQLLAPGGGKCLTCDEIDPMTSRDQKSWTESAGLRPPAETKKPQ
jgi:ssDNA-binding Zn-finger/Zn-ribbon topoisomerase 1